MLDAGTVFDQYLAAVLRPRAADDREPLRIVYTPLHGVGGFYTQAALEHGGNEVIPVLTQFEPDGRFPTVDFPNPEEPGALDEAFAVAGRDESCDLVIANDPDADRLAVSVPEDGDWRRLVARTGRGGSGCRAGGVTAANPVGSLRPGSRQPSGGG